MYILPLIGLFALLAFLASKWRRNSKQLLMTFPIEWRSILNAEVDFYTSLEQEDQKQFEYRMLQFLNSVNITSVETEVEVIDRVLIGASAIIPIFGFENWSYSNVQEIILYPGSFNKQFDTEGKGRTIRGMVGTGGYMEGKMILSQHALRWGFSNNSDKRNTAVHEFVHLMDKFDGDIDGLPKRLMDQPHSLPWLDLMDRKIAEIHAGKSDIDAYAGTEQTEFFAVVSEYFFERPKMLKQKHPQLYDHLEALFDQNMDEFELSRKNVKVGRNDPCPCGSGKKFKKCHYRHE